MSHCSSCLVTDGSTGDELDSDGELPSGLVRKKSTKKSRTRSKQYSLEYCKLFCIIMYYVTVPGA